LPASFKVHYGQQKRLHRQVCQGLLPAEILRRKKRGFAVNVVDDWFRGTMKGKMEDIFMDNRSMLYQYLRPSIVQRIFKEHQSGQNDYHKMLFSLVVFEEWLRVQASTELSVGEQVAAPA
jgi:asparagine synthase (glutamine-hydrolysing)